MHWDRLVEAFLDSLTAERGLLNQPEPLMARTAVAAKDAALAQLSWREINDTNHYSITLGRGAAEVAKEIAKFTRDLNA